MEKVRQMLAQDRRLLLRLIAEELGTSKDTTHTIVRDDLGKRKNCSRFVPHKLTSKTDANFWKLHFHVWPGSTASGKHRHGRWGLVLPVRSGKGWRGVHRFLRDQKRVVCKNPSPKHRWSSSSTTMASSIRNLFLQAKPSIPHFTR